MDGRTDIPTRPDLLFRVALPHDDAVYAALLSAVSPANPTTPEELSRERDTRAEGEVHDRFLVWGEDGTLEGAYHLGTPRSGSPEHLALRLSVHPDHAGRGLEERLLAHAEGRARERGVTTILAGARTDEALLDFYLRRGFRELDRMWGSTLDVRTFDPAPFEPFERRAHDAGIRLYALADTPNDEAFMRRHYETTIELLRDVPSAHEFHPWPFELWLTRARRNPDLDPHGTFLAMHGDEIVGLTELLRSSRAHTIQTGLTGVRRSWRRRGVAQTLKLAAARHARQQGHHFVRTNNHSVNRPMLSINEAMGFVKEPAWVNLTLDV